MSIMGKHSIKEWVATTRYWSFSVSALPVLAAVALLCAVRGFGAIDWLNVVLAVVGVVLFHAAGNLLSDVGDYRSGADSEEAFAVPNLVKHFFEPKEYLSLSAVLFALGIAVGLVLVLRSSLSLLVVGGLGFVMTLLYTKSKLAWLSDVNVFCIFGVLILLGTSIVAVGEVCYEVLWLSLPLGLITLSVLHSNNAVDIQTDGAAGLHTIAMALGLRTSAKLYVVYQILPFVYVLVCAVVGVLPWTALLCLVSLPVAVSNIRQAFRCDVEGRNAMMGLDLKSAKLQLLFSLTLAVGLCVAAL